MRPKARSTLTPRKAKANLCCQKYIAPKNIEEKPAMDMSCFEERDKNEEATTVRAMLTIYAMAFIILWTYGIIEDTA